VKLFLGSSETSARIRLLGSQGLKPGESAFIQLRTDHPVVASKGDRFILRLPSPSETLGGGMVLDPEPGRVYKRFDTENLDRLDSMFSGNDNELINQILTTLKVTNLTALSHKSALPMEEVSQIVST